MVWNVIEIIKLVVLVLFFYLKTISNTPGTAGGPGGRDRTLAVKSRKTAEKITFFSKKIRTLVVEVAQYKTHGQRNRLAFYVGCRSSRLPSH